MVNVVKWDGRSETFQRKKVSQTIVRMGASPGVADELSRRIEREAYEGITTKEILDKIYRGLKEHRPSLALRRDLRTALGLIRPKPDFEEYVRLILSEHGYKVSPNQVIQGLCVTHEIDGIARKNGKNIYIETKRHADPHSYTPFEVTLSAKAKWDDMNEGFKKGLNKQLLDGVLIVCNTRFTDHARRYADCVGLDHIGWNFPEGKGLDSLIEEKKLYPVSMLEGLTDDERDVLSERGILTLKQLVSVELKTDNIPASRIREIVDEAERILGT